MSFDEEIRIRTAHCNDVILKFLPLEEGYAKEVIEAMNYSVNAGGKRLRPMFIYETNKMYCGRPEICEPFMAAIEMIHTYSLVHDDLPEMDNDEYRRGRKTTHAVYGQGMAVLAGDGLLNFGYETATRAFEAADNAEETENIAQALLLLAANAGIYGMVGGQCADLVSENEKIDDSTLLYIHKHKTACMIESGLQIGAILAGAPSEEVRNLGRIGEDIGIAFQIQDDILDVEGNIEQLGKTIGKDAVEGKNTYVSIHGIENAKADVRKRTDEALKLFDGLSVKNDFLRELMIKLVERTN